MPGWLSCKTVLPFTKDFARSNNILLFTANIFLVSKETRLINLRILLTIRLFLILRKTLKILVAFQ